VPAFAEVLAAVADAWRQRRAELLAQGEKLAEFLRAERPAGRAAAQKATDPLPPGGGEGASREGEAAPGAMPGLTERPLEAAEAELGRVFDPRWGGFGPAPKFPHATQLSLLLRRARHAGGLSQFSSACPPGQAENGTVPFGHSREELLQMALVTLDRMAAGGIYDQLGGGFHRYSVDAQWLVPHFEKMLYDSAGLAGCYLDAWQATARSDYRQVLRETLDYTLRDMSGAEGGFFSAEDADSEGQEGRFYLWTPAEVRDVLGPERAHAFSYAYDVTEAGNFEGRNILHLSKPIAVCARVLACDADALAAGLAASRGELLAARSRRVRPARDGKVLASWNGLFVDVLARAGAALPEPRYTAAAARAADFLLGQLCYAPGRLAHCWRAGKAKPLGFLDDYASLANALITLDQAQPAPRWIEEAGRLADAILERFSDPLRGGFFYTPVDHEPLVARKKDLWDSPLPSSSGLAATALVRLARRTGRAEYRRAAEEALQAAAPAMCEVPLAAGQLLLALDLLLHEDHEGDSPIFGLSAGTGGRKLGQSPHEHEFPA
jgi:uncharacterized protein YyaL (SSP411 family)